MELKNVIKEACVETLEQCLKAEEKGADRLELCGDLSVGGITPDLELVRSVLEKCTIPVKVMVRCRSGNFVYTPEEVQEMKDSIDALKTLGVQEIVFGALSPANTIDLVLTREMAAYASPMNITFHKAIDRTPDIFAAIEDLKAIPRITSILSSGKSDTAEAGSAVLEQMKEQCGEALTLIAAGKVSTENLSVLHQRIKAREYHGKLIVGAL